MGICVCFFLMHSRWFPIAVYYSPRAVDLYCTTFCFTGSQLPCTLHDQVIYPWHHSARVGWRTRMKGTKRHSYWIQFKNSMRHNQWQREMGNDERSFPIRGIICLCEYYKSRMVDLHSSLDFMFAKLAMDQHTNILWWKRRLRCSKQSFLALWIGVSTILAQMVILDKKKNPINAMHNKINN